MVSLAMMQGIKRGLFSNEAGMGSAPNAAAASNVKTPGQIKASFRCSVSLSIHLSCVPVRRSLFFWHTGLYENPGFEGVALTQMALESQIGAWGDDFLAIILFLFAYSSVIGNLCLC